ncbi:hypothetical protein Tco_0951778 [Tanacetum coccineum]|uniref:Integrase, catalytic region, zinc finger, CCHC-type, peptidase aspartic, catalytic n=1 Tax=Tanacetum coccineum TaxID=301880 RepID=A0ABQ5DXX2_9ASTR
MEYAPLVNQQPEFPQPDSGLIVPVFKQGDDPIDAINHMMSFISVIVTSCYPTTNNQLRNTSNPRQQATINDGRVTLQPVQGRQIFLLQGQVGHTFLEQVEAILGNKGLLFVTTAKGRDTCPNNALSLKGNGMILAKITLMANLSHYGSDALAEVYNHDNVDNNLMNQVVQAMPSSKQSSVVNNSETEITSDSNIIPYSQYKEQVKVLKEGQNVDLKSKDNVSDSCEQSVEIDRLKQTLSEHLKEKESLMQTVTLLKNDFKKEESRNIDREIALEKKIKQLDNIVFKRDQSAQTVHMLTKPQFFYDHTTKQALGFQNPFYLKKAQQLEPKLYDGNVIKNTSAIVIPDSEETLMLAEESRLKMLLKQQDPMMLEKKVNTTPVDYVNSMNSSDPTPSNRPTKVEVPKELPKVSMVNTILKKLKHHLVGFDVVVKEITTATAITEGSPKCLSSNGTGYGTTSFRVKKTFEVKMNQVLNKNKRLLEQVVNKDIMNIIVNSSVDNTYVNVRKCKKCLKLETELLNKKDFVKKEIYDKLFRSFTTLEKHYISLEVDTQLNHEIFLRDNSVSNQSALSFDQYFELNELKAQSQEKDMVIKKLKEIIKSLSENMNDDKVKKDIEEIETINIELDHREQGLTVTALKDELGKLKGKCLADNIVSKHTIDPEMLKIDVEYLNLRLLNNRSAHFDYLKHTQEEAAILREIVEQVKSPNPLNNSLDSACCLSTRVKPSTSASGSQPSGNTKKDKIQQTPRTANVQHSKLNANSELLCVKCNGCMLSDNHDLCVLDFINDVNARNKSKYVKKIGNTCPLTRITTTAEVPLRKPTALESDTPKHVVTLVYLRKPKKSKTNVPVSKPKNIKSLSANKKEPTAQSNDGRSASQLTHFVNKFLGTIKFRNDHVAKILGYGDYQIGNVTISRVYYVEGLGHNLFSVGQFCDSNLEVAFCQHTCFIRNLEGVNLLTGSRGKNLYTLSLGDMMASSPICLLSKALKTKLMAKHRKQLLPHVTPKIVPSYVFVKITPYELYMTKLPDLSFFHVFGALCYPTNDSENLDFDELTAMASGSGPALHEMTP